MKHKRLKLSLLSALLAAGFFANAAEEEKMILSYNGELTVYMLESRPKISFRNDNLQISTPDFTEEYSVFFVDYIAYEGVESSIVNIYGENPNADFKIPFIRTGANLIFSPHDSVRNIALYDLSGRALLSRTLQNGQSFTLNLKQYLSGIGVLTVNGVTYKIAVK